MFWNKKEEEAVAENPTAIQIAIPDAVVIQKQEPKPIEIPPFGTQAHGLIRFGKSWLNLSEMVALEFDPPDGCGAECIFKGKKGAWHIPEEDAAALRSYLEGFESAQKAVDEAAESSHAV